METAQAKWAATLILFRDSPEGVQVYLQRRPGHLRFAPGAWVFPGGKLDQGDLRYTQTVHATPVVQSAGYQDISSTLATALAATAIRETFEECSVLLAAKVVSNASDNSLAEECRRTCEPAQQKAIQQLWSDYLAVGPNSTIATLAQRLEPYGLRLDLDGARPIRRWVTPAQRPRRFDTVFFAAEMPEGQVAQIPPGNHEAEEDQWVTAGHITCPTQLKILPPTWAMLNWIGQHQNVQHLNQSICSLMPDEALRPLQPERPDRFLTLAEHVDMQVLTPSTAPAMSTRTC